MKEVKGNRPILAIILVCLPWAIRARRGPPSLTDDPDTPGPNHWEINVGGTSDHAARRWPTSIMAWANTSS
jgi:hypothetical protein